MHAALGVWHAANSAGASDKRRETFSIEHMKLGPSPALDARGGVRRRELFLVCCQAYGGQAYGTPTPVMRPVDSAFAMVPPAADTSQAYGAPVALAVMAPAAGTTAADASQAYGAPPVAQTVDTAGGVRYGAPLAQSIEATSQAYQELQSAGSGCSADQSYSTPLRQSADTGQAHTAPQSTDQGAPLTQPAERGYCMPPPELPLDSGAAGDAAGAAGIAHPPMATGQAQ